MIEMIGVLGVIATISMGLYGGIAKFQTRMRIASLSVQTKDIIKSMRDHFSRSPLTSNPTAETLYKIGIFDNVTGTGASSSSVNSLKNEMTITIPNDTFSTIDKTFRLTYKAVDFKICVGLLTADWGSDPSSGLAQISAGSVTFWWPRDYSGSGHKELPPSMADALEACNQNSTTDIFWEYYF